MAKDLNLIVGTRVQTLRKLRGMTQEQLAEAIGKTVETVSNIERGEKLPRLTTVYSLCAVLEAKLSDLLDPSEKVPDKETVMLQTKAQDIIRRLNKRHLKVAVSQLEALADN